jgi:very-short-patch-repair endonuclease
MGKSFLKGDAVWPDAHLVVEYDGYYHASSSQMEADAVRRATLRHAGWTVIEVTRRQIISIDAFDQIAQLVAKQLGRRLRNEYLGATAARLRLIDEFFYS